MKKSKTKAPVEKMPSINDIKKLVEDKSLLVSIDKLYQIQCHEDL